jgi:hypothetical protein
MRTPRKICLCPQHQKGLTGRPVYLHRSCPTCMKWLGGHSQDIELVRTSVPGHGAYTRKGSSSGWMPQAPIAAERRRKHS